MTARLSDHDRALLEAPLATHDAVRTLGRSLWLYVFLLASANSRGFVLKTRSRLAKALGVPEETVGIWLARLVDAGLVHVVASASNAFLVLSLCLWSGEAPSVNSNTPDLRGTAASPLDKGPVYGNSHSNAEAIALEKNAGDRGLGKGDLLRDDLRAILPDAEPREIALILHRYPRAILGKAIDRVKTMPPTKIRKSKVALFRFLLAKFSEEIDINDL